MTVAIEGSIYAPQFFVSSGVDPCSLIDSLRLAFPSTQFTIVVVS